jgi:hypothetical protein
MQAVFIVVVLTGLSHFLFAKRQFDFFTVAFISACIYFLPGFFGYTHYSEYGDKVALCPNT